MQTTTGLKIPGYQEVPNSRVATVPKSNFVTTDGYVPSYLTPTQMPLPPRSSTYISPETNQPLRYSRTNINPETIQPQRFSNRGSEVKIVQN
jgi:hypothetical protein